MKTKKIRKQLSDFLVHEGWSADISKDAAKAYMKGRKKGKEDGRKGGVKEVVRVLKWMDDKEHDDTTAIVMDIAKWYLQAQNILKKG